jgi:hypothetical protein
MATGIVADVYPMPIIVVLKTVPLPAVEAVVTMDKATATCQPIVERTAALSAVKLRIAKWRIFGSKVKTMRGYLEHLDD